MEILDGDVDGLSGFLERRENVENRKEADDVTTKHREQIRQALKIDRESWRAGQEDYLRTRVSGTGQWLMDDPQFSAWADGQAVVEPILVLEAREGFGKNYLC